MYVLSIAMARLKKGRDPITSPFITKSSNPAANSWYAANFGARACARQDREVPDAEHAEEMVAQHVHGGDRVGGRSHRRSQCVDHFAGAHIGDLTLQHERVAAEHDRAGDDEPGVRRVGETLEPLGDSARRVAQRHQHGVRRNDVDRSGLRDADRQPVGGDPADVIEPRIPVRFVNGAMSSRGAGAAAAR